MKRMILALLVLALLFTACDTTTDATEAADAPTEAVETTDGAATDDASATDGAADITEEASGTMQDGTYTQTAHGYGGEMTVDVVIEGGELADVTIGDNQETVPVFSRAKPLIEERMVEAKSPAIHAVSGATFSTNAAKQAVKAAMEEAGATNVETDVIETMEMEIGDTVTTDVLVIGGGPSGLSAAIEAKAAGVENVLLIEKLDILSGNGKFDMNFFDLINSEAMAANDVEVTKEEFIASKADAVDSEARVQAWADGSWELDEWLRGFGVELNYNYGGEKGTNHMAEEDEYAGDHIQMGLEAHAKELGVEIRTGTRAVDLIMEDGAVKGAKVNAHKLEYDIEADAVIVATGGFSHNPELLAEYAPGAENIATSNQMGATGDFVTIFQEHDIQMDHMDILTVFRMILTRNRELTGAGDGFIWVNQDGERFVDESSAGLELAQTIKEQDKVFYVYDQRLKDSMYRLTKHNELGYHVSADSVEALAEEIGIDAAALQASIDQYNAGVTGEAEDPIRPEPSEFVIDTDGPLYAAQIESAIHMTKGGVVANENAQVLNNADEVVLGLYASGEVTDTTGAYSASVVFGRIAGQQAAAFVME